MLRKEFQCYEALTLQLERPGFKYLHWQTLFPYFHTNDTVIIFRETCILCGFLSPVTNAVNKFIFILLVNLLFSQPLDYINEEHRELFWALYFYVNVIYVNDKHICYSAYCF